MKRIGLVNLTPNQLELMSGLAQKPEVELVAAVHDDAEASSYKIAQVMEIPIGTGLDVLAQRHVDVVIAPEAESVRRELRRLGLDTEVLTTEEAAARFGVHFVDGLPDYSEGWMPRARRRCRGRRCRWLVHASSTKATVAANVRPISK